MRDDHVGSICRPDREPANRCVDGSATVIGRYDDRHVEVDEQHATVWLSKILKWYRADFLEEDVSLLDFVNRYRMTSIPLDYRIRFRPYDWTLNSQ